ncbi:MAG: hypothetical protein JRG91_07735 [Deltaproteobacteria bacterium]|nr:hypothetical protein [Deltaproteobacteria bacterium]
MLRFVLLMCLAVTFGCKPATGVESASGSQEKEVAGEEAGETGGPVPEGAVVVTYMGVKYTVGAAPQKSGDGWRVEVTVEAEIVDGQEHAFVRGKMKPSDEALTSLKFAGSIDGPQGVATFAEPAFTGNLELEMVPPDVKTRFVRLIPAADEKRLGAGDVLDLTVGIWGTEGESGGQRYAPDLARLLVDVSGQGEPDVKLAALDPEHDPPKDHATFDAGSHQIVIKPFYPYKQKAVTSGTGGVTVLTAGGTVVRIKNGELVVGEKHFGTLDPTSEVLVDDGKVSVDGEAREGKKLIKAKLLEFHSNQLTEHKLAGHKVYVSPGAAASAMKTVGGASKLVLDETVLMIEDSTLYVDGVCYGTLEKKATIKLFFGDVHVGGKKVEPVED